MPTIISQPSTTTPPFHPIGSLDALFWKLQSGGAYQTVAGVYPSVTIRVDADNQTSGNTFSFFGQLFSVSASPVPGVAVNLTAGTALEKATRIKEALLANVEIFPHLSSISLTLSGSDYLLNAVWNKKEVFADVYSNGTLANPYTITSETLGTAPAYTDGYKIAYQLFQDDGGVGVPLTSLRSVTPKVVDDSEQDTEIDFSDVGDLQVTTTKPFNQTLIIHTSDSNFSLDIFLRYGSHVSADGDTTWAGFADSNIISIVNMALPMGDAMTNYYYRGFDDGRVKFLTSRPRISAMPKCGQRVWLWAILDVARYLAIDGDTVTNYFVEIKRYDSSGTPTTNTTSIGATDRVLIYPAGSDNFGFSLDGFVRYTIQIKANVVIDGSPEEIEVTEVMTFHLDGACECAEPYREIYFQVPQGGYDTLAIHRVETVEVNQDYLTHETAIDPEANEATQRIEGGYSTNSHRSWIRINLKVRKRYTPENLKWLSYLRSSPDRYIYDSEANETYRFIPDAGTMEVYRQGEFAIAEMTGRLHYELPVLQQPNVNRV